MAECPNSHTGDHIIHTFTPDDTELPAYTECYVCGEEYTEIPRE